MLKYIGLAIKSTYLLILSSLLFVSLCFITAVTAEAATLSISPNTGVYTANGVFSVNVVVNTQGKPINAADATLSFNPRELSVVSVNRSSSIFNLWVAEPSFSNAAGTINFSGGSPAGYTGSNGSVMTVTFRAAGAGTARVNFTGGSVLANDGKGTNVLTSMNGGTFTIQALSVAPTPEIIEYVAPANTPPAPVIISDTHTDQNRWFSANEAVLRWTIPSGVTAIRTLLDTNPTSIPTKVYDDPIRNIDLSDLPEGESYFHLQFRNDEGWGKVSHYRLAVDSEKPTSIDIFHPENANLTSPHQVLQVLVEDSTTEVSRYRVKLDADEPFEYIDEVGSSTIPLPALQPGYHTVIIEAFDQAGNSIVGTYSFTIESFDKPVFTDYPSQINEEVIPVIKGLTRPGSTVDITLDRLGGEPRSYSVTSSDTGEFIFIPEGTFSVGVYEITARATDEFGAQSELSDSVRIAVQQPGYLRIGSLIVSVLSVVIPLAVLLLVSVLGIWYFIIYVRRFRKKVRIESIEALEILNSEFSSLQNILREQESLLQSSRKTKKLTKAESQMIEAIDLALQSSQVKVEKEIEDVTDLVKIKQN